MINVLASLTRIFSRDPEFAMDLAYGELQSELISLRRQCAQAIAFEQRLTDEQSTQGQSVFAGNVSQRQPEPGSGGELAERTAAMRELLLSMEGQVEGFCSLKQWILLSVPMGDPALSRALSTEYCRACESVIQSIKGLHRFHRERTANDVRAITRHLETDDSARKRLGQLVRQRLTALVERISQSAHDKQAVLKLKRAYVSLENRLTQTDNDIKYWTHEAIIAKDSGNELSFLQAQTRRHQYERSAQSIREALEILSEAMGTADSSGTITTKR